MCEGVSKELGIPIDVDRLREWVLRGEYDIEQKSPGYNLMLMFRSTAMFAKELGDFDWQILVAPDGQSFLTSDHPVVSLQPISGGGATVGVGIGHPGVEVFSRLGAKVCIRMRRRLGSAVVEVPRRTSVTLTGH